jgi:mannosyltransferase
MNSSTEGLKAGRDPGRYLLTLAGVILAGFALRTWLLGDQNIWWDEGLAIWAVRKSWIGVTLWTASDVHPPIYFWLLKAFVSLAGESEFAARFISVVCGMVTVSALYPLGKRLLGRKVALLATALLALGRFHIWWSQEMRMYIVATMWGVLSLYALVRWFQAERWIEASSDRAPPKDVLREGMLYVLTSAAGLYSLYLFVVVVLIENTFALSVLLKQPSDKRTHLLRRWVLAQLVVLLLFAPWSALALPRMRSWSVAEPFDARIFLQLYATLLPLGISTHIERYLWLVVPFFAVIGAAMVLVWRSRSSNKTAAVQGPLVGQVAFLLLLFLLIPPLVVYVLTRPRGLFYAPNVEARYLVLFAPAFYLLLAWSIVLLHRRAKWLGYATLVSVLGIFLWTLPIHYQGRYLRDEHQTMVRTIAAYAQPGDAVLLVSGNRYPIFEYYYGRLPDGPVRPPVYFVPQQSLQVTAGNVEQELAPLAAVHPRLWLAQVNAPMQDPEGLVEDWLDQRYARALSFGFAHNALTLYGPAGEIASVNPGNLAPQYPLSASLAAGAELLGYDLPTPEFRSGDTIRLALYYASQGQGRVVVRLADEQTRVLERRELEWSPAETVARQQLEFRVYSRTPAGLYHFEIEDQSFGPDQPISFGRFKIAGTEPLPRPGAPPVVVNSVLQGGIELLGYQLTDASGRAVTAVQPGATLTLDLYWRAQEKLSRNYTVFAHLVGQAYNPQTGGPVWAGHDSEPLQGGYPTTQWFVGETIVDRHLLTVAPLAPAGEYELEVGLYLLATMTRLRVLDDQGQVAGDRIVLGHFQLPEP